MDWAPRDPAVAAALAASAASASEVQEWGERPWRIRIDAHLSDVELPDAFVGSVRVLVQVEDRVVVCTNVHGGSHPWPGGRREPGETHVETACREVHEETGWLLDPASVRQLGWLHLEHLDGRPPGHPHEHADFLMVVYTGRALDRDGGRDNDWCDVEGHEVTSRLLSIDEAIAALRDEASAALPFLAALKTGDRAHG